ncbi:MAG: DNA recombination protein RmuC [Pseudomonadota bacterium]
MNFSTMLQQPAFMLGQTTITWAHLVVVATIVFVVLVGFVVMSALRNDRRRRQLLHVAQERAQKAETQVNEVLKAQAEMQGKLTAIADTFGSRQSEMTQTLNQRLDAMTHRIGQSISEQQKSTHDNLSQLKERLAVIDTAQSNIQQLAGQVVELQSILSNKQTRGAFGQGRMEAIIEDGLPHGAFEFQATLSNGKRPDCVVSMPNDAPGLVIDAKFPLESWNAIRDAADVSETAVAQKRFASDMSVHIKDIAGKYLISGETQDTAFLFVPSESIFADLHEHHESVVQMAHKHRVVIVSPSLLMLSIQVIQALLKDARMREQAHLIQSEVIKLVEDLGRLDDRVRKLQTHFGQANNDIEQILVSTNKIGKRGRKIETMDFEPTEVAKALAQTSDEEPAAESASGQLRLRVVEGEEKASVK